MSNKHTNLQASDPSGHRLSVSETTTDSPILPAANLQQLQQIDPSLVQWVVKQTESESIFRRTETRRVNTFIFLERISGVIVGAAVAIAGLTVAAYVAIQGHEIAASVIGGATLVAIVTVIVTRKSDRPEPDSPLPPKQEKKHKR